MSSEGTSANPVGTAPPLLNERYELGERLAEGTFFFTYRGRDTVTGRSLAIKVLKPEYSGDEAFTSRLLSEAQSATRLRHPNIAEVYDAWLERGTVIIVTEWVRGINLKDRIRRVAPFPLAVAMDILLATSEALAYAHQNGFVHGDVRPDNIIITPEGRVKLTDFGVGIGVAASTRIQLSALSQAAFYMAPEIAQGRMPTPATDQYSLGCILYEMLVGTVPFEAESPLAVAGKHLHEPAPSVRKYNAALPNAVDGIALRCMQKDPATRYADLPRLLQDVNAVREALRTDKALTWSPMDGIAESSPVVQKTKAAPLPRVPKELPQERQHSDTGPSVKLLGGLALLLCLMFAGSFGIMMVLIKAPRTVNVPPGLVGKKEDEAAAILKKFGLVPEVRRDFSDSVTEGKVFDAIPPSGREIREGKTVILYVSQGGQPATVPDVVGKALATAQKELRNAGLVPGHVSEEFSELIAKGEVISQSPTAQTRKAKGTAVELTVSKGSESPQGTPPPDSGSNSPSANGNPPDNGTEPGTNGPGENSPGTAAPEALIRDHVVTVEIPKSSKGPQRVRIVVRNEDGTEKTWVDEDHQPGEKFDATVSSLGAENKCELRVYVNNVLNRRQRL